MDKIIGFLLSDGVIDVKYRRTLKELKWATNVLPRQFFSTSRSAHFHEGGLCVMWFSFCFPPGKQSWLEPPVLWILRLLCKRCKETSYASTSDYPTVHSLSLSCLLGGYHEMECSYDTIKNSGSQGICVVKQYLTSVETFNCCFRKCN
jgi:hypothetical protein